MRIITTERIPIKLWLDNIDRETLQQVKNLANFPFTHHHIALMPDAHVGYGMPIGGVAATIGVVIPNAVGVDIGCGVRAVRTSLTSIEPSELKKIVARIRETIPLGFNHHKKPRPAKLMPDLSTAISESSLPVIAREFEKGRYQLGTLGGGNHFIEIQMGNDGHIWLMIHSGSRNIGYRIAGYYNQLAKDFHKSGGLKIDPKWQLDYLPICSTNGSNYFTEMEYCVRFAAANRKEMMSRVCAIIADTDPTATFAPAVDIAHNYASKEHHFGEDVIVHRKGATKAVKDGIGIIPGSQGSNSFIVKGLGAPESFMSCSHGAGRKLGRKQARRQLNLAREIEFLKKRGVIHAIRHKKDLDEAAGAYKDVHEVLENQQDLVEKTVTLSPLAVVKG
ncbi:RtcB family protein [Desulforhopalus singaporensis]|uniref:3'-phosphate/5'-hydroxy nucleic acid ligase n=1 Tax=Desulforhopalus singaporensis TaxID=91360 RepID=A0A1H0UHM3_9BACT|nr:RtcB family protein [Desulforhopalus singaporensis]SDP65679.1 tRNA-splicing ligase RtcB [Desulforhopalus singaporensis]